MADAERIRTYGFYFNPNIFPAQEYLTRKNECQQYCRKLGIPFVDGDYDHALWREAVKGLEHEPKEVFAAARALACACLQPQNALSGWASNRLQQPGGQPLEAA